MDLISVSSEDKDKLRQHYNVTESEIAQDIELIKTWISKQPHLPQNLTDDFIEKILLRNKFRVERTKQKLENYYTLRGNSGDLIRDFQNVVPSKHVTTYLPLPKLGPNQERFTLMKIMNPDPVAYDIYEVVKIDLAIEELTLPYEYSLGVRYLFDFEGFTLKHLMNINPFPLAKHITLLEQAYSSRILGFELINFPPIANKILAVMKLVLRPKIYERIKIHENMDSVYEVMPKEYLPIEYGGTLSNIPDLLEKWDKAVKDHHDYFLESYENISKEHLRIKANNTDDGFGVEGTFKQLAID